MSIASLSQTLTAVGVNQVSSKSLSDPLSRTFDKILNLITLGIYGAYKNSVASGMKNDLLDLGKAIIQWNPEYPEIPVHLKINNNNYEIHDMPNGGIELLDCASGKTKDIQGVSISSMRDMIFSDLMNHPDFAASMERRIYEDSTTHVDLVGLKQERANACGEASRNMILAYHGLDYAPATNSRPILEGNDKETLISDLKQSGLIAMPLRAKDHQAYTSEQIRKSLENGPLLCELKGHFLVIHGVNEMFDRVDVLCPLLGHRCTSLADLNSRLDWEQEIWEAPLTQFKKTAALSNETPTGFGKSLDPDFSPSMIDRLGVALLTKGYAIGNSWLKSPESFINTVRTEA